jgi:hypothetical protein
MPNLTTPFLHLGGTDINKDMDDVQNWSISLIDELKYILCNLDAGNCQEASKVKAQNIDCSKARIHNAQIQSLTADKLTAGTIDAGKITIKGEDEDGNKMVMSGKSLIFYEKDEKGRNMPRIYIGFDGQKYVFEVYNKEGNKEITMNDDGNVIFSGTIRGGKIDSDTDINVNKDVYVGQYLRVGFLRVSVNEGIPYNEWCDESGIILSGGATIKTINGGNSISILAIAGINLDADLVRIKGKRVLTEEDLGDIKEEIRDLENRISALENK